MLGPQSQIEGGTKILCICTDSFSSKRALIECTLCKYFSHKDCMSENAKMKKFVCAHCQLLYIDPLQVPV